MNYVPYENGRFRTASPDSQGVPSSGILKFLKELERLDVDIQSLYIFRNGYQLLGANRKPYAADRPRRIHSAAKALTGLAALFAISEGLVSLDTHIVDIFPEDVPENPTERMKKMTVRHLLTMTTGHDADTFRPVLNGKNSVRAFLEEPLVFEPGEAFLYNNGVPHILGLIVQKVSGLDFVEYLRPRVLEPLGIWCEVQRTDKGELEGSSTVCTAEGFAKLSLLYLQEGNWNGKQLLDAELMRQAISWQVPTRRCRSISFTHKDQLSGYGYQIWRNSTEGARLDGGRSQFGFLFPEKNLAIVCNAIEEDSGLIPTTLWNTLYPEIRTEAAAQEDAGAEKELAEYIENWSCVYGLAPKPSLIDDYYGCRYDLEDNLWGLKYLTLSCIDGKPQVELGTQTESYTVSVGLNGDWITQDAFPPMPKENERLNPIFGVKTVKYFVSGGWMSDFCFVFQVRKTDWMDYHTFYCRFCGERLSLVVESNEEKMSHMRRRIPMKPRDYPDHPIEGRRN